MGEIRKDVRENHLRFFPKEEQFLKPFLPGFYVTWGGRRKASNTELSVYILSPEPFISEAFGFFSEILLVYAEYDRMESRTLQAAESFLTDHPGKGRVETLNYFLVSEYSDVHTWVNEYIRNNEETRIIITFSAPELRAAKGDTFYVRNALARQFYTRDLFDFKLPLIKDTYFFGRSAIMGIYIDSIKRGENKGLFGLRKTGKTSILFKIERLIEREKLGSYFFYDCKSPSIRKRRWNDLLAKIIKDIAHRLGISITGKPLDEIEIAETFTWLLKQIDEKQIVLVFDEIEYISFFAKLDDHWRKDYLDFWQTIWACQSRMRNMSIIIAGVSPRVVEADLVDGIQNPLFGIVSYQYLHGFEFPEMKDMVRVLGKKMGINFSQEAMRYIFSRYGGHPLLTRLACSAINHTLACSNLDRPFQVTEPWLMNDEENRDSELQFYCRHVVSELFEFYPQEYELLELLACGHIGDFMELAVREEHVKHLKAYGLLHIDDHGTPKISLPIIGRFIALDAANREGRKTILKVIAPDHREKWINERIEKILKDLRLLEKIIRSKNLPKLFGPNSFPEADKFCAISVCDDAKDFRDFINTCNRCFVESIEAYGLSITLRSYFWNEIQSTYPQLFDSLKRIKVYRHDEMHIELNPSVSDALVLYLRRDLEGQNPSQVNDLHFVLQQCVLDSLFNGIQVELNRHE